MAAIRPPKKKCDFHNRIPSTQNAVEIITEIYQYPRGTHPDMKIRERQEKGKGKSNVWGADIRRIARTVAFCCCQAFRWRNRLLVGVGLVKFKQIVINTKGSVKRGI
jgi:hypothetical protein